MRRAARPDRASGPLCRGGTAPQRCAATPFHSRFHRCLSLGERIFDRRGALCSWARAAWNDVCSDARLKVARMFSSTFVSSQPIARIKPFDIAGRRKRCEDSLARTISRLFAMSQTTGRHAGEARLIVLISDMSYMCTLYLCPCPATISKAKTKRQPNAHISSLRNGLPHLLKVFTP
jgi:hypothetical protein